MVILISYRIGDYQYLITNHDIKKILYIIYNFRKFQNPRQCVPWLILVMNNYLISDN